MPIFLVHTTNKAAFLVIKAKDIPNAKTKSGALLGTDEVEAIDLATDAGKDVLDTLPLRGYCGFFENALGKE